MSIQSEITRISGNVSDAFTAIAAKGGTVPTGANSDDLATAIASITTGGLPEGIIDISSSVVAMSDGSTPEGGNNYRMYAYSTNASSVYASKLTKSGTNTWCSYQYQLPSSIAYPTNAYIIIMMNDSKANMCKVGYFTGSPLTNLASATSYNAITAHISGTESSGNYPSGEAIVHFYDGGYSSLSGALNYIMITTWNGTTENYPTEPPSVYYMPTTSYPNRQGINRTISSNTTTYIAKATNIYDELGSVNVTTSVPAPEPTIDLIKYTGGAIAASTGGNTSMNVSSVISNTTTPFTLLIIGGKTTNTTTAGAVTKLHYNGSTFSVTYDGSSNCPTIDVSGCNINSSRYVNIKFTTYWYPHGASSSSASQYYMPVIH